MWCSIELDEARLLRYFRVVDEHSVNEETTKAVRDEDEFFVLREDIRIVQLFEEFAG